MLLRLLPNEYFSLVFPKELDENTSQLGKLQLIRYNRQQEQGQEHEQKQNQEQYKYYFINESYDNFTVKFVFNDDSVLYVPVEVFSNRHWVVCSPFEVHVHSLHENPSFGFTHHLDGLYCHYSTRDYLVFENLNVYTYRYTFYGEDCVIEHVDLYNNSMFITDLTDQTEKTSIIMKPTGKIIVVVQGDLYFKSMKCW